MISEVSENVIQEGHAVLFLVELAHHEMAPHDALGCTGLDDGAVNDLATHLHALGHLALQHIENVGADTLME